MAHNGQSRAAHLRHANRAGGFHGGKLFTFLFPGDEPPNTETSAASNSVSSVSATTSESLSTSSGGSSSSPTSSSSSTTRSSTSELSVTTTFTGAALHDSQVTKFITHTSSATFLGAGAVNSAPPVTRSSSALAAPVIGGVAGGILGLAGLIFLLTFCLRRRRKVEDPVSFDPGQFRRSAMLLPDPPTHQDTVARGFNPPASPVMVQRERQMMYANTPQDGRSPTSANALMYPQQQPFSPIAANGAVSPVSAYAPAPAWNTPVLTRNASNASSASTPSVHEPIQSAAYPTLPASQKGGLMPENDSYLDLERTSVTPFQAAQYVEISKHLNTEVPKGLDTPAVDEFVQEKMTTKNEDLPPLPPKDPFSDADAVSASSAASPKNETPVEEQEALPVVQDLSFPSPPSPVRSVSRYRVDSSPPMLPEIHVQSRVSVASAYFSDAPGPRNSSYSSTVSPLSLGFPSGQTLMVNSDSPMGNRFPVTPSPLASSFTVPSPPAGQSTFPATPTTAQTTFPVAPATPRPDAKKRETIYTVYDPEDAYGGI